MAYDDYDDDDGDLRFDPSYVQWSSPNGQVFMPASMTVKKLPAGVYEIHHSDQTGLYFEAIPIKTEGLIRFPDTNSNNVLKEIQKFWGREEFFRKYGLSYRRGIILYGPPGSGKTCTIQLVMQDVVERAGVVIRFDHPRLFIDGYRVLRKIQPETPVVAVMEDLENILENYDESLTLNTLDGMNEMDRIVFLATTNFPDKLGHRIMNRPSRFDKRYRIGFPSSKSRKIYFEHLIGREKIEELKIDLDQWVKDTDKFSVAHLKELFVAVVILGDNYKAAIKALRSMKEEVDDKDYEMPIGFVEGSDDKSVYD